MLNTIRARAAALALLGLLLVLPLTGRAQAQGAVLTGKVTTEFGQPIEGVNVFITELSYSIGTNAEGMYTINIPTARVNGQQIVLRVRSFGYVPQMRPVTLTPGTQTINFALKQDVNRLQEVVVTGVTAGTEQKKLAFTVSKVDEREMPVPSANPLSQLQGKVPGANIVQTAGRPGAAPAVLLRGPKSINAQGRGQEPLYIVDGVVLQGGRDNNRSPIADINPQDIESVELIKGAAAASMFGSRAGNGVISITTKTGRNSGDGIKFTARTEYGRGDIERKFPLAEHHFLMMDETRTRFCAVTAGAPLCARTMNFEDEALRVNENAQEFALTPVNFERDAGIARAIPKSLLQTGTQFQVDLFPVQYDPVGQMVTPGQNVNTTIDASGRSGGTSFFASGNSYWQQGAIRYLNGYKRNSLRLNVDQQVGSDWTFGVRTYYSRNAQDGANQEQGTAFFRLTRTPVGVNILRTDNLGRLFIRSNPLNQGFQNENPAYWFANERQMDKNDRFLGNLTARYTPLSWLDIDGNVSYDRTNANSFFIRDKGFRSSGNAPAQPLGRIYRDANNDQSINSALNASARKSWGDLNTRYTARYLYEQQDFDRQTQQGDDISVADLSTTTAAKSNFTLRSETQSIRAIGLMGGVDADWKDRYIVGALFRRDGSSLFGSESRWANYGRGSLAWRVSQEPWWFVPAINELKFRGSVGSAGGRPRFAAQYETFTFATGGLLSPATLGNKNLKPETTIETEVGIDAEVLNRFGLNVTYAQSDTKDQILPVPPPVATGFNSQWKNAGTLQNKTWEASVNVPLISRRNLSWSTRLNFDQTRTKITKLSVPPFFDGTSQQGSERMFYFAEGERYGTIYGRKFVTSCSELPSSFQAQCGGNGAYQKNSDGYIVWVGAGNKTTEGITKNLWNAVNPTTSSPWGVATQWGMPMVIRNASGAAIPLPLGNALPDYRMGISQTLNYKRVFLYGQLDAAMGQSVWNEGRHWSLGDFMDREEDQDGKSVEDAKPVGYYWRAPAPDNASGVGGFYDLLQPNSRTVEKASYAKIREVSLSYNLGPVRGTGDWTLSLIGRNLKTFTDYTGFDPEVGITNATTNITGSSAIAAVDAFQFPNLRTFTFAISTRF